jgi:hypothetical protein
MFAGMIRRVRFAILALLILGVFAAGAALDWSGSIRTDVPAIELQPAPAPLLTGRPASPIRRTSPAKAKSADRKSRTATRDVRPVSPPEPARLSSRAANRAESPRASTPRASTNAPRKAPAQPSTDDGDDGGTTTTTASPPTETLAPRMPTAGAAPAPTAPEPAGDDHDDDDDDEDDDDEDDDDEDEDDDGDDGGDDD